MDFVLSLRCNTFGGCAFNRFSSSIYLVGMWEMCKNSVRNEYGFKIHLNAFETRDFKRDQLHICLEAITLHSLRHGSSWGMPMHTGLLACYYRMAIYGYDKVNTEILWSEQFRLENSVISRMNILTMATFRNECKQSICQHNICMTYLKTNVCVCVYVCCLLCMQCIHFI